MAQVHGEVRGSDPEDLRFLAEVAAPCRRIVELGVFHGLATRAMLSNSQARIWCIDTWRGEGCKPVSGQKHKYLSTEKDFYVFLDYIWDLLDRIVILKMSTQEAAGLLPHDCFDMVFIDAGHSYEEVKYDILHYAPLVRPGGLLCGHDYRRITSVARAVDELMLITPDNIGGKDIWWIRRDETWPFMVQQTSYE